MFNQPINNNAAYDMVIHWSTYSLNNDQQNEANPYQDLGLMRYSSPATYEFMATRNNDFSNRSHKGRIEVSNDNSASPSLDAGKIALIAGASVGGVVVVGGGPPTSPPTAPCSRAWAVAPRPLPATPNRSFFC